MFTVDVKQQFNNSNTMDYSDMDGYVLQDQKSVVLKMNSIRNYPESEAWKLGSKEMPVVDSTTHMGILRTSTNQDQNLIMAQLYIWICTKIIFKKSRQHSSSGFTSRSWRVSYFSCRKSLCRIE